MKVDSYDVIVVGGGHAGAEAAWAAAKGSTRVCLVSHDRNALGRMSCNPAIGGIGKGQIVREVDALGGLMGLVTDEAGIQFRMLNRRKGPAVWAPRAQADSRLYTRVLTRYLEACPNLTIVAGGVEEILTKAGRRVTGVVLDDGQTMRAGAIVLATGTFLQALMHTGDARTPGGRVGEAPATGLSDVLRSMGLRLERLKTGTPPRVARDSVDFAGLQEQTGDPEPSPFSFMTDRIEREQVSCWITETNPRIHDLIRESLHRAPLYCGQIESTGPRYCPSIETKIVRFPDKTRHQVFLEPEGLGSERIYVNGISTSLPIDVQKQMVRHLPGLERARIVQWGYAVEYDFVPPEQINASLMTRAVEGLFLAGQINGTSGYEEAAGQGLVAGINAVRYVRGQERCVLGRDQAYIGVMIDDLVTRGVIEPYRMFSSRAEHRMHLRYDNADARLTPVGREWGLVENGRWERFRATSEGVSRVLDLLRGTRSNGRTLAELLRRPEEDGLHFLSENAELRAAAADVPTAWDRAVILLKYDGYIERQRRSIERFRELESRPIPFGIDYGRIPQLRQEAVDRWSAVQPANLGQASRVSGIKPTDVTMLMVFLAGSASDS